MIRELAAANDLPLGRRAGTHLADDAPILAAPIQFDYRSRELARCSGVQVGAVGGTIWNPSRFIAQPAGENDERSTPVENGDEAQ